MKTIIAATFLSTLLLISCDKIFNDNDCENCDKQNVACTEEYRMISVQVLNTAGQAVEVLDYKVYFAKDQTDLAPIADLTSFEGSYAIATDGMMDQIDCDGSEIIFEFTMDNKTWLKHAYIVGKDCCHIKLNEEKSLEIII